jgi:GAF domain-containing protein
VVTTVTDSLDSGWPAEGRASSDVATLRESLAVAERRAATLAELTALMSEGRDPLALAQRAVELTARAARAAGAFVYLWDPDEERLVLRVGTEGWQRGHLGRIKLRLGEGITGWSALMRQAVVLSKDPLSDPRFKHFPELRETSFKSMIAVPIVAPGEEVLGVFSLWALTEDAFTSTDASLASEVGALLASGLVQAGTLSQLRIQSAAARFLCDLPDEAWGSLEHCLRTMAGQCAAHLEADICMIEVTAGRAHPQAGTSVVAVTQQFREEHDPDIIDRDLDRVTLARFLAPLNMHRMRIPLGASAPIGALTCFRARRFTSADELLLEAIGAQVAAGVLSLIGAERARPVLEQLLASPDARTTEQLLRRYEWEPCPAWATMLRIQSAPAGDPQGPNDDRVRSALVEVFGGDERNFLLLGGGGRYLALAETAEPAYRELVIRRIAGLAQQPGIHLTGGIGPLAATRTETHRAIRHAVVTAQWAELSAGAQGAVVRHEDVAHLRLLPSAALAMSADLKVLLDALGALVRYDVDNQADLARTLDALLASGGSVAKASAQLFIHRNTLRQRIQRVEELIGQSPEKFEDSITAGVAARLICHGESELGQQRRHPRPATERRLAAY